MADILPHLLADFPRLRVIHAVGRAHQSKMEKRYTDQLSVTQRERVAVHGFIEDVYRYSGAADIVITRAGATNLAEFSRQGKACIIVPSPFLAAGHQMRNAEYLADQGAAVVVNEAEMLQDPNRLAKQAVHLLRDPAARHQLEHQLAAFARPDATADLTRLITEQLDA